MGEGGHIEEALDQVGRTCLAQPQEDEVPVLQQKHAGVCESFLGAAYRSRQRLAANIYVVLGDRTDSSLTFGSESRWPSTARLPHVPVG